MGKRSQQRFQLPKGAARLNGKKAKGLKRRKVRVMVNDCGGKRRYRDKQEADDSMHGIQNGFGRPGRDGAVCRSYECPGCKGWHLTSRPA